MDLIEELFKQSGLKSKIIEHRSFSKPAAIQFPCSKSIGFHVVTLGQAFIHCPVKKNSKNEPLRLKAGDIVLMARGQNHWVSTDPSRKLQPIFPSDLKASGAPNKKSILNLVSGAYQLWNDPIHPFFSELPEWHLVKAKDLGQNETVKFLIQILSEETEKPNLGSEIILKGILDVLFSFIVRKIIKDVGHRSHGWSRAVQNESIKKCLEVLHGDFSKPWTLDDLAKKSGLSRAGFALKFKKAIGDTPFHYLTTLRIQAAVEMLSKSESSVQEIAKKVGYNDAFVFSKSFKKLTGTAPREFRLRDRKERLSGNSVEL